MTTSASCPLCQASDAGLLWSNTLARVVAVDEAGLPGYTRVIWTKHVAEMTDLPVADRARLMDIVWRIESAQRQELCPDKINMAQFGTMVPHLHWHVIPRWASDPYFPLAIWAAPTPRNASQEIAWESQQAALQAKLPAYHRVLIQMLSALN